MFSAPEVQLKQETVKTLAPEVVFDSYATIMPLSNCLGVINVNS